MIIHAAITCPTLMPPANADPITYSTVPSPALSFGTTATYTCSSGFSVTAGDVIRTCGGDGSSTMGVWNGMEPTCGGWCS